MTDSFPCPATPAPLREGDTIAIVSPASSVKGEYVDGAARFLQSEGFRVRVMPHALGPADGSYAAAEDARRADFVEAYSDPSVRALLCSRGGYGCAHFIDSVDPAMLASDPKWVIGFSDVSALHAMMRRAGVRSIHASMARHLTLSGADECTARLLEILRGASSLTYSGDGDPRDMPGSASGELRGGNLAVLDGLSGSSFDLLAPHEGEDVILFIEDVGEAIYRTERMVRRLALSGALRRYRGIVVGQFTESRPDLNFPSTADMLRRRLPQWGVEPGVPVAFNFPVGHTDVNLPLVEGAQARLEVRPGMTSLRLSF